MDTITQAAQRPDGGQPATPAPRLIQSPSGVELRELISKLWRRRMVIVATVAILTVASAIVLLLLTPVYQSTAKILLTSRSANVINLEEALVAGLGAASGEIVESELSVITSRRLANKVIDQLGLDADPEFNPALQPPSPLAALNPKNFLPDAWLAAIFPPDQTPPSPEDQKALERSAVVDTFLQTIKATREGLSLVIVVTAESESPEKATKIVNTLADLYILDQLEVKYEQTSRAAEWLAGKIDGLRQQVEASEQAVEKFRRQAGLIQGAGGTTINEQQISELSAQLILARSARAAAEAKLNQVQQMVRTAGGAEAAADVLASPLIQALTEKEATAKQNIALLEQELGERHPRLIAARAELRDIQAKLAGEVNKIVQGLQSEVGVARAREASLAQSLEQLKGTIAQSNTAEVQLRALEREAAANRTLLETFLARFEEENAKQGSGSQEADARIISRGDIPTDPSFPKKTLMLGLIVVASTVIGIVLVLLLEQLDRGFRSSEQIEGLTGVSVLSLVPTVGGLFKGRKSPHDYVLEKPTSAYGEAVRSLYTSILLSHVDAPPKKVLFSSAESNEGKTTTAVSFGRLIAKGGKKVVIVDADLRRPSIGRFLDKPVKPGLVEVLLGDAALEEVLHLDEPSGAYIITAGKFAPNAADVINSEHMRKLLDQLALTHDMVILDSPPVRAVSDARVLASLVDRVVFCVRWASTRRETVVSAMRQVAASGGAFAGVVLCMVDVKKHAEYGFGDSGYYHGQTRKYYVG